MQTINGIFPGTDGALRAGEKAREVIKSRSAVRVFMPGPNSKLVETAVVDDKTSWMRVMVSSLAIGAVGAGIFLALDRATYAILWLLWSVGAGVMFGLWLNGQKVSRDLLRKNERPSPRVEEEIRAGHAVVTAAVTTEAEAEKVVSLMEAAGGHVVDGTFQGHPAWHAAHPAEPAPSKPV
jgi:hypothetical protein